MRNREGFVLIAVLWLLIAVAAVSLDIRVDARTAQAAVSNELMRTDLEFALGAATAFAVEELVGSVDLDEVSTRADVIRLPPDRCRAFASRLEICTEFRDLESMADVNMVGSPELQRLIAAAGVEAGHAHRVTQVILDWRDIDDLRRDRGAEHEDYVSAHSPFEPRNAPIRDISELAQVLGIDARTFDQIGGLLMAETGGRINLNTAPGPVLLTLPGFSDPVVRAVLARRAVGRRWSSVGELRNELPAHVRVHLDMHMTRLLESVTFETTLVRARFTASLPSEARSLARTAVISRSADVIRVRTLRDGE